jgi:hypothetical protein
VPILFSFLRIGELTGNSQHSPLFSSRSKVCLHAITAGVLAKYLGKIEIREVTLGIFQTQNLKPFDISRHIVRFKRYMIQIKWPLRRVVVSTFKQMNDGDAPP